MYNFTVFYTCRYLYFFIFFIIINCDMSHVLEINYLILSYNNSTCRIYSNMWTWWDILLYIFNSQNVYIYLLRYMYYVHGFTHACENFTLFT